MNRRYFLNSTLLLTAMSMQPAPAKRGSIQRKVAHLAASKARNNTFAIQCLDSNGDTIHTIQTQSRGHSFAFSPESGHMVSIPPIQSGSFTVFGSNGDIMHEVAPEEGRQFYGHGVFDKTGSILYLTENNYETGEGVLGLYNAKKQYERIGETSSYGVAPHQIERSLDDSVLIVANSGVQTHPQSGMRQLNDETMAPSLSFVDLSSGKLHKSVSLESGYRFNTLRHFTIASNGTIYMALQNRKNRQETALLSKYDPQFDQLIAIELDNRLTNLLRGYIGDIALNSNETRIIASSRHGNAVLVLDTDGNHLSTIPLQQVSGLRRLPTSGKVIAIAGNGSVYEIDSESMTANVIAKKKSDYTWENHLVSV